MPFQIEALNYETFEPLFALDDDALAKHNARRVTAEVCPGLPCRVSLEDAQAGETLILTNHTHLDVASPYRATHAIFVRKNATKAAPEPGEVPEMLASRLLSIRAFGDDGWMREADVLHGTDLAAGLARLFKSPGTTFIDIHNAKQGCFAARARPV